MLSPQLIAQLAAELDASEKSRLQVEHFSKRFPGMTMEDGYAISRAWVKMKTDAGRVRRGHKIGLTSRAMQQASQIDEPDFGTLLDDMFFAPWGERLEAGDTVLAGSFTRPVLAKPGDRFDADYGRLGRLQFNFV